MERIRICLPVTGNTIKDWDIIFDKVKSIKQIFRGRLTGVKYIKKY